MTSINKVTIAIPTFNRLTFIKKLLYEISDLNKDRNVEILVIDNKSNDGTLEWLNSNSKKLYFNFIENDINIGIEGNIIKALTICDTEYVWLLSDHMSLNENSIISINNVIINNDFDVGYTGIQQYDKVLDKVNEVYTFKDLDNKKIEKLLFNTSNISGLIVNKRLINKSIRHCYRFSFYSYPHLGLYACVGPNEKLIEFNGLCKFNQIKNKKNSYDTFKSRFVSYPKAINNISALNKYFPKTYKFDNTALLSALKKEVLVRCLSTSKLDQPEIKDCLYCILKYPVNIKIIFMYNLLIRAFPVKIRVNFTVKLLELFIGKKKLQSLYVNNISSFKE